MAKSNFSFNLLPPKSKEVIAREENRSNSLLYAAFLLFGITLIWLSVRLIDSAFLKRSLDIWNETRQQKEIEIDSYNTYKSANGELVMKTRSLAPVVEKHTDPDLVFDFIDSLIKQTTPNVDIVSYGRTSEGTFQFEGLTSSTEDVASLILEFNQQDQVEDARLNRIREDSDTNKYSFIIDLDLTNLLTQ
ncbi:hypothetical protein JW978_01905 [Candidatus Dojkabacteria bacterium]|nr:hypothetical protein [Candidatus Dojkabacteria bacterium]